MVTTERYESELSLTLKCLKLAKEHGIMMLRITPASGHIGFPDYIAFKLGGKTVPVEFKSLRGSVSHAQRLCHARLRKLGFEVFVIRDATQFFAEVCV